MQVGAGPVLISTEGMGSFAAAAKSMIRCRKAPFWVPKLRVVEARVCRGSGGFGRGVEPFVGFGLPLGCGVVLAMEMSGFGGWVGVIRGISVNTPTGNRRVW